MTYFGLRKYDGGEEVWGGDDNCQHEWGSELVRRDRGSAKGASAVVGNQLREVSGVATKQGNFCSKCNAWRGQLGAEPTPELYIQHLVEICREVRRVLRLDGCFFLNIGDSWSGSGGAHKPEHANPGLSKSASRSGVPLGGITYDGIKPLDMVLIPEQLAIALRSDGWYLRSILIWAKGVSCSDEYNGNPMPESVNGWRWERHKVKISSRGKSIQGVDKYEQMGSGNPHASRDGYESKWQDCLGCPKCEKNGGYVLRKGSWRATDSYEHILMLTKTSSYFCDREAVLEGNADPKRTNYTSGKRSFGVNPDRNDNDLGYRSELFVVSGRNLRSVLDVRIDLNDAVMRIPTTGFKGSHFAVFPPRLVEPLIKSATSEKGCCLKCGSPWARVIDKGFTAHDGETDTQYQEGTNANRLALLRQAARQRGGEYGYDTKYGPDATGLPQQGFQRDNSVEAERVVSREEAKLLFPDDERKQQGYVNHIHDHGGLDKGRTIGWLPTCQCGVQETEPCRVLDPFSGAGTVALVSERLGLDSIGIDTSAKYIQLAEARIADDEQKRIDEQIKQIRKEAKQEVKGVK